MISVQVESVFFRFFGMMAELRPSGFPEYSPAEQLVFDQIVGIIQAQYQQFGYTHIHTPAVEKNDVLLAKNGEETGKQIFGLYGMAQGAEDLKEYGLHFDLTVPFARYTLDWEHQLTFPFKRYQIQPVWRGERAQKGRFREFFQCDIDTIWKGEKDYFYYDAEIIAVLGKTLTEVLAAVNIQDSVCFHINNKKIIRAFLQEIAGDKAQDLGNLIDKYAKIGQEKFLASLQEDFGFDTEKQQKILKFIQLSSDKIEDLDQLLLFSQNEDFLVGISELRSVLTLIQDFQKSFGLVFHWVFDMQIIRGLDYYTGTIFEAVFENEPQLGSICGGGRYQNLTGY
ncbi:histidine--tRNA ligase family protein, partial [Candidatus Gracilibacteria bacterium]|nr:histidine--tRNA ligase family protein [Candidatus Gracilibacteria bacterium]